MYRAVLVDDEPLVLEGLQLMVDWRSSGFEVVGEARDGEDALALIREKKPDLVVTDIRMPVMGGLELIQETRRLMDDAARFIVLSGYGEFDYAREAMQHEVLDYMLKPIEPERFADALGRLRAEFERAGRLADRERPPLAAEPDATRRYPVLEAEAELNRWLAEDGEAAVRAAVEATFARLERMNASPDAIRTLAADLHFLLEAQTGVGESPACEAPAPCSREAIAERAAAAVRARRQARTGGEPAAEEAARLVRERFREPVKLSDIAKEVHLDAAYLGVLFKRAIGDSFHGYLHRIRIEEAKKLLRRTDLKIAEVGRRSGYRDADDFARRFKEIAGTLPSEYKHAIGRGG